MFTNSDAVFVKHLSNICLTHPGNLVRHLKTTIQLSSDLSSLLVQVVQLWGD